MPSTKIYGRPSKIYEVEVRHHGRDGKVHTKLYWVFAQTKEEAKAFIPWSVLPHICTFGKVKVASQLRIDQLLKAKS